MPGSRATSHAVLLRRRLVALIVLALLVFGAVALARALLIVDTHGASVTDLTFHSRFVGRDERMILVSPAGGGDHRPLLVLLHGRSPSGRGEGSNAVPAFFAALRRMGSRAPTGAGTW